MALIDIARKVSHNSKLLTVPFEYCDTANELMNALYDSSLWKGDFREDIERIRKQKIARLTMDEVLTYFTFIVCTERTQNGCFDHHIQNGTVVRLLKQYVALYEQEDHPVLHETDLSTAMYHALLGLAVADAVGVPAEFQSRVHLDQHPISDMVGYGTHNQPMGTWSDDTSMALCLAYSLKEKNGFDADDIMRRFSDWLHNGAYTPHGVCFDCGNTCAKAIHAYNNGTPALLCGGRDEYSNGNGSLMRILPILSEVLRLHGNEPWCSDAAMQLIHDASALTHAHPLSLSACGAYISIATCLVNGCGIIDAVQKGTNGALRWYRKHPEFACAERWQSFADPAAFATSKEAEIGSSGFVADTLSAAIWSLLNTDNYRDCVLKAVNLGEDTDTTAAVAGGLAGLAYGCGEHGIPKEWIEHLQALETIREAI